MPGSGKSTVGRQLARRLGLNFIDADVAVEQRLGCTIREYFEQAGEPAFRDVEESVLDELTAGASGVIATGGGAVLRPVNRERLRQRCVVLYLRSKPEEVYRRTRHDVNRPLLQVADPMRRLRDLYNVRDPLYRETAHHVLETGRPSVNAIVRQALQLLSPSGAGHASARAPDHGAGPDGLT